MKSLPFTQALRLKHAALARSLVLVLLVLVPHTLTASQPLPIYYSPWPYTGHYRNGSGYFESGLTPRIFDHPIQVSFYAYRHRGNAFYRYTLDGSNPDRHSTLFSEPITIWDNTQVNVTSYDDTTGEEIASMGVNYTFSNRVWHPKPGTSWQWQLSGALETQFDVDMYDIDLFSTSTTQIQSLKDQGRRVICHFSAGSYENGKPDTSEFPSHTLGKPLPGQLGERWLDIRNSDVHYLMLARLDLAKSKGCDGVEPDHIDGYQNDTGFNLTAKDQIEFNTWLANHAHKRDLSIGLKNDLAQAQELVTHFDWAISEACFERNECNLLEPFIAQRKAVFGVEYRGDPDSFCPQAKEKQYSWLKKNVALDADRYACPLPENQQPNSISAILNLLLDN